MKPSLLFPALLAALIAAPLASIAQQTPAPAPQTSSAPSESGHERHGRGWMAALRGVQLTPDQQKRIDDMMAQFRQAHPRGTRPDPDAMKQFHQQLMDVLTPEQQTQVKANMERMRSERHANEPEPSPSPGT